jgi:sulfotransferase family protein
MNSFRESRSREQRRLATAEERVPMPVIIGVPRSGTTLLRFMLDAHPALAIPPETGFLVRPLAWPRVLAAREALFRTVTRLPFKSGPWQDFGLDAREFREELRKIDPFDLSEGFRAFYRLYARKQNKPRYGDKTPLYCEHVAAIEKLLPEAHFVHIIRDGRDVALSLRPMPFAPGQDMKTLALYWRRLIQDARQSGRHCRAYLEIRYEQLVRDPASVLAPLCTFLKLDFDPAMLRYWERATERLKEHRSRCRIDGRPLLTREQRLLQQRLTTQPPQLERVSGWKEAMSPGERAEFLHYAGETLQELGYEP